MRQTQFSMFGTDRIIQNFRLEVRQLNEPNQAEECRAWGCVSYTAEIDFLNQTEDDCIIFYMFVKPDTFARYAHAISASFVTDIILTVQHVAGFYSEWSPSISTQSVKVLAGGREQKITMPNAIDFDPPRLGDVGGASLHFNRRLQFRAAAQDTVASEGPVQLEPLTIPRQRIPAFEADPQTLTVFNSLKRATWLMVGLLGIICLSILF